MGRVHDKLARLERMVEEQIEERKREGQTTYIFHPSVTAEEIERARTDRGVRDELIRGRSSPISTHGTLSWREWQERRQQVLAQ